MGPARQKRIDHEKIISEKTLEVKLIEEAQQTEADAAAKLQPKIDKLAVQAVGRNPEAVAEQKKLIDKRETHELQHANLARLKAPVVQALAEAQAALPQFVFAEAAENICARIAELPERTAQLSALISPVAAAFAEFQKNFNSIASDAFSLLDHDRSAPLRARSSTAVITGLRSQLSGAFRSVGLNLFETPAHVGQTFDAVLRPLLESILSALAIASNFEGAGTGRFRCVTNVSGLFGLTLRAGEIVSLPIDDDTVKTLIANGALERVIDEPLKSGVAA
jgi:hypothetical protein